MNGNRIDQAFQELRSRGRKAFIPFFTAADPDLELTARLVHELSNRGANVIELGIPYSDPIADGPVIQASYTRALARGARLGEILAALAGLSAKGCAEPSSATPAGTPSTVTSAPLAPLVTMVSYAIVLRHGLERFVGQAKQAGVEGAIVPDLPVEEAGELASIAAAHDFKVIMLVTPTTPRERAIEIARASTGFIYYVSVTGITGERTEIARSVVDQVAWLKTQTDLPVCIGFGISRPEHVRLLAPVADGVIVGSAIVRRVADGADKPRDQLVREIGDYVATLIQALQQPG